MEYEALIGWDPARSVRALRAAIAEDPESVVFDNMLIGRSVHTAEIDEGDEIDFVVANGTRGIIHRNNGRLVVA